MAGLGSFVDGFVGGMNQRNAWDDRKRQIALDAEDRKWLNENRDWARGDRTYTVEERQRLRAEQDRVLKEAQDDRDAKAAAWKASQEGGAASEASPPQSGVNTDIPGMMGDPSAPSLSFGSSVPSMSDGVDPGAPAGAPTTQRSLPGAISPVGGPTSPEPNDYSTLTVEQWNAMTPEQRATVPPEAISAAINRSVGGNGVAQAPAGPTPQTQAPPGVKIPQTIEEWNAMTPEERALVPPGAVSAAIQNSVGTQGRSLPGARPSDAEEQARLNAPPPPGGYATPGGPTVPPSDPNATAGQTIVNPKTPPDPRANAAALTGFSAGTSTSAAAPQQQPAAPPMGGNQAAAAAAPPPDTTAPAIAAAMTPPAPKAGRSAISFNSPLSRTPEQETKAVKSTMENYRDIGVPKLIDYYMSRGEIDRAQALKDWATGSKAQDSMTDWSKALHSLAIGDADGLLTNFTTYINGMDVGVTVDKAASKVTRDENGIVTGFDIAVVGKDGKTTMTHYNGMNDMVQTGLLALPPDKLFEESQKQQVSTRAAVMASQKLETSVQIAQMKLQGTNKSRNDILNVMKIFTADPLGHPGFADLPPEEQASQAADFLRTADQGAANYEGGGSTTQPADPSWVYGTGQ
jgi:hypothetical protein